MIQVRGPVAKQILSLKGDLIVRLRGGVWFLLGTLSIFPDLVNGDVALAYGAQADAV